MSVRVLFTTATLLASVSTTYAQAPLASPTPSGVPGGPEWVSGQDIDGLVNAPGHDYEVLLIASHGNPQDGKMWDLARDYYKHNVSYYRDPLNSHVPASFQLDWNHVNNWVSQTSNDPELRNDFIVEAIVQGCAMQTLLTEKAMTERVAAIIQAAGSDDEARFHLLSRLSYRLYDNYNDARNPGYNTASENPDHVPLPAGDITLPAMMSAAAVDNIYGGGVCNDIVEVTAQIAQKLFPDSDVLAVTGGSHFGVLLNDGKQTRIIDGGDNLALQGKIALFDDTIASSMRVSHVVDGNMKEIAVVDTQLGQLINSTFQSSIPNLRTDTRINQMVQSARSTWAKSDEKRREFSLNMGQGQASDSQMLVLVARQDWRNKNTESYLGVGGAAQHFDWGYYYHVAIKAGFDRRLIRYVSPRVKLEFSTGVHFAGQVPLYYGVDTDGLSGDLNLRQKVDLSYRGSGSKAVEVGVQGQVINSLGPSSWGKTTGAMSTLTPLGVAKALGHMSFHLNQVFITGNVFKPISSKLSARSQFIYQGSNIGQRIDVSTGIEVKALKDNAMFMLYVGYENSKLAGYQTKYGLLNTINGGKVGVGFRNRKGVQIDLSVQGIQPGSSPRIQGGAIIPIHPKKNRRVVDDEHY